MICETLDYLKGTRDEKVMGFGGKRGVLKEERHILKLGKTCFSSCSFFAIPLPL
jgi:hypothetical protein